MHPSHKHHLGKLNRISGQVDAVKRMIEAEKYCVDIMMQIKAARAALKAVELAVLETHMHACLDKAHTGKAKTRNKQIGDIMALLKKYE